MHDDLPFQPSTTPGDSPPTMPRAAQAIPPLSIGPERFTGPRRTAKPVYSVGEALRRAVAVPAFQSLRPWSVLLPERFRGRLLLRRRNALAGIAISPDNGETGVKCVVPPWGRQVVPRSEFADKPAIDAAKPAFPNRLSLQAGNPACYASTGSALPRLPEVRQWVPGSPVNGLWNWFEQTGRGALRNGVRKRRIGQSTCPRRRG